MKIRALFHSWKKAPGPLAGLYRGGATRRVLGSSKQIQYPQSAASLATGPSRGSGSNSSSRGFGPAGRTKHVENGEVLCAKIDIQTQANRVQVTQLAQEGCSAQRSGITHVAGHPGIRAHPHSRTSVKLLNARADGSCPNLEKPRMYWSRPTRIQPSSNRKGEGQGGGGGST